MIVVLGWREGNWLCIMGFRSEKLEVRNFEKEVGIFDILKF